MDVTYGICEGRRDGEDYDKSYYIRVICLDTI